MAKDIWDVGKVNELARKGDLGRISQSILEEMKPDAAYFLAEEGKRSEEIRLRLIRLVLSAN